ncbi:MAG: methyltransferase domain-containing protein [Bifidobacteriaceae bacterium]|nr:methyltransferase domain-containing protein [Bifidobacteriaceae bacterium]
MDSPEIHRQEVRQRYAALAAQCGIDQGGHDQRGQDFSDPRFGSARYDPDESANAPTDALAMSLGCGNPVLVADLRPGERVADLGAGGGLDVILSARRVGPAGFVYGIDMTPEMVRAAQANASQAGVTNIEFRLGVIEDLPLTDASIDVVISNCVLNLSADKPRVLRQAFRVLVPGGRIGLTDVVADDAVSAEDRIRLGRTVGCVAGALSRSEYLAKLAAAGFTETQVRFTHQVAPGMHGAIIKATKPRTSRSTPTTAAT